MKPHEPKNRDNKDEKEGGKRRVIKNQIEKRRKGNKTLSHLYGNETKWK
jgi:hypothetical protein